MYSNAFNIEINFKIVLNKFDQNIDADFFK